MQAEEQMARLDTQSFRRCVISGAHLSGEHLCTGPLSTRLDIFGEPGKVDQLLGDLMPAHKGPLALFPVKQPFIDQICNGLTSCHTTDPVFLAQFSFRRNEISWLP